MFLHFNHKTLTILAGFIVFGITLTAAAEQHTHFDGPYVGLAYGKQNIFGGSFIDQVDILAEDKRSVIEFSAGWRKQWQNGITLGLELQLGSTDGDLAFADQLRELFIDYENNDQFAYGISLGKTFGRNRDWLTYLYAFETERKFDVSISTIFGMFSQQDKQGVLRYGIGLERALGERLHLRAAVGRVNVDFGDLETNIGVEDETDWQIGVVWQF